MPAAPRTATEAQAIAAAISLKASEILAGPKTGFSLSDAIAGAVSVLIGFYGMAFLGNILLAY